jgi:hypothetical protein
MLSYNAFPNILPDEGDDDDDVYLIKLQRMVSQNLMPTRRMQISLICGISKENT